jgi:GT2 family glycosyltransferase
MATTEVGDRAPHASIVVLNYNGERYLGPCLSSVFASDYPSFEVIVVDNASTDRSLDLLASYGDRIRLIRNPRNLLSTRGLNPGIRAAQAPIVVLLDTDTEVRPTWLGELIRPIRTEPDVAITGSKLLYPDGIHIQHAGGFTHRNALAGHFGHGEEDGEEWSQERDVEYVTGAATAIRVAFLDQVGGGLSEIFPFYYEDCDICHQALRLGYRVLYVPSSVAIHHESVGMGRGSLRYLFNLHRGRARYLAKNLPIAHIPRAILTELSWLWFDSRRFDQFPPVLLAYASVIPVLPAIFRSRLAMRQAARRSLALRQGAATRPATRTTAEMGADPGSGPCAD